MNFLAKKTGSGLKKGKILLIAVLFLFSYSYPILGQTAIASKNAGVSQEGSFSFPKEAVQLEKQAPLDMKIPSDNFLYQTEAGKIEMEDQSNATIPQSYEPPDWVLLNRTSPKEGYESSLAYDPVNQRAIFFSGRTCDTYCSPANDTWALNLQKDNETWQSIASNQLPPGRQEQSLVYDSERQRMILYGGQLTDGSDYARDVWALNLTGPSKDQWQELNPSGITADRLSDHVAVYDSNRNRMIVFSGGKETWNGSVLQDTTKILVLNFNSSAQGEWENLYPQGPYPAGRDGAVGIFDPINDRMIVFGGYGSGSELNDTWALDFSNSEAGQWINLDPSGDLPSPRWNSAGTYDPVHKLFLIFGGVDFTNAESFNDLWVLNLENPSPQWVQLSPNGRAPEERGHHNIIFDEANRRPIIYGGALNRVFIDNLYTNTYTVTLNQRQLNWERIKVLGEQRREYYGEMATVYDSLRNRLIIHGGNRLSMWPPAEDQIYTVDLDSGQLKWKFYQYSGINRFSHQMVYDVQNDRLVLFGGQDGTTDDLNKVHFLDLSSENNEWQTQDLPNPPAAHRLLWHSAIYDPQGQRMIVFGGSHSPELVETNEVWALDLTLGQEYWYQINPQGALPPARYSHSAIYDPVNHRMIIYGGHNGTALNDVWALDLTEGQESWTELETSGEVPEPHYAHAAMYDSLRQQMVIFGGLTLDRDTYALDLSTLVWKKLNPLEENPPAQNNHSLIYDPVNDRGILLTGNMIGPRSDDTYLLLNLDF